MSATIFLAKEKNSNRVYHIDEVNKLDNLKFKCTGCDEEMIVVKAEAAKKTGTLDIASKVNAKERKTKRYMILLFKS